MTAPTYDSSPGSSCCGILNDYIRTQLPPLAYLLHHLCPSGRHAPCLAVWQAALGCMVLHLLAMPKKFQQVPAVHLPQLPSLPVPPPTDPAPSKVDKAVLSSQTFPFMEKLGLKRREQWKELLGAKSWGGELVEKAAGQMNVCW